MYAEQVIKNLLITEITSICYFPAGNTDVRNTNNGNILFRNNIYYGTV